MRARHSIGLTAVLLAVLVSPSVPAQQPAGPVTVAFQDRERYADAVHGLEELKRHVEKQGARYLAPGQRLAVIFTGVDRAGHEKPSGTRVVRDLEPARIQLEFALLDASGNRMSEGRRSLRSPAFFVDSRQTDPLYAEKALLDGWLESEFGRRRG